MQILEFIGALFQLAVIVIVSITAFSIIAIPFAIGLNNLLSIFI